MAHSFPVLIMIKLLLAVGLAVAVTPALAQSRAGAPSWYLGAGVGLSKIDQEISDGSLWVPSATSSEFHKHDVDTLGRLMLGVQLNPYFAIEGGYQHLGRFWGRRTVTEPVNVAGTYNVNWKVHGFTLDLLAIAPLTDSLKLIGKVGVMRAVTDVSADFPGFTSSQTENRMAFRYGLGLQIDLTSQLAFRADAEINRHATNTNQLNIGGEGFNYHTVTGSVLYKF